MTFACRELGDAQAAAWDRFVDATPAATFFHRAGWRTIMARAFGHAPQFLYTERDGAITGILPLAHMKTRLFGRAVVSLPFCVYGGPVAVDGESTAALEAAAKRLMTEAGAPVLEWRGGHRECGNADDPSWRARSDLYVTFRKPFTANDDTNLKAIPRKQRAMVRKGIDRGLTSTAEQDVDRLHAIYAESVRNLGTPVFGRRYFRLLASVFRDCMDVVTVREGDVALAAVMNFYFRDEVLPYYGGGTRAARETYANDFMYWEVMRRAAARGARLFDYGRSKVGTGAFAFKKNWGFEPTPLTYRYYLRPGAAVPDHNPLNPKYRLFIAAWKRLPLPVANVLGPPIVRGIG
ncbi:MAG: FemAB family PEP-CTERM system-associated protein [Acidisphaera sp.]|nr:FemAB family PEP-CTERM system-associated protein [Acidisphaera sp.]MBV9811532.1 FemAB family PEP-CTERM system-associated protein [Acetobacteraceae bacterium]